MNVSREFHQNYYYFPTFRKFSSDQDMQIDSTSICPTMSSVSFANVSRLFGRLFTGPHYLTFETRECVCMFVFRALGLGGQAVRAGSSRQRSTNDAAWDHVHVNEYVRTGVCLPPIDDYVRHKLANASNKSYLGRSSTTSSSLNISSQYATCVTRRVVCC